MVQKDFRVGISLASLLRQAIPIREAWIGKRCARGRPHAPCHWSRDLFVSPPSDAEIPDDVAQHFDSGRHWLFDELVR